MPLASYSVMRHTANTLVFMSIIANSHFLNRKQDLSKIYVKNSNISTKSKKTNKPLITSLMPH